MRIVVLPGMDGGAELSKACRARLSAAAGVDAVGVEYPFDEPLGYDALEARVREEIGRSAAPTVLVAESFSGPIAARVGASPPAHLRGVLLVATFVRPPMPSVLSHLVGRYLFALTPPRAMIRRYMLDPDGPEEDVDDVVEAIRRTGPPVMARRLKDVLTVDACESLRAIELPLRYLEAQRDRLLVARRALPQCRPDVEWHIVDAPHLVLKSRPDEAARAILDFVDGLG